MAETKIVNPYPEGSEEAKGFDDALKKLANALFGEQDKSQQGQGGKQPDSRLIQPPQKQKQQDQQQDQQNKQQQNQQQQQSQQQQNQQKSGEKKDQQQQQGAQKQQPQDIDVDELADKISKLRDKSQDVVDDAGNLIDHSKDDEGEDSDSESDSNLSPEEKAKKAAEKQAAKDAKEKADAEKRAARLQSIKTFFDDPNNQKEFEDDMKTRRETAQMKKELAQARKAALAKREGKYPVLSIKEITNNIVNTLKNYNQQFRDSDWYHYNPRSGELGYYAPGRFNNEKKNIPTVVFYFDMSGSWRGNEPKLKAGYALEEALRKLDKEGKIHLLKKYFADRTSTNENGVGYGNSDAPSPDIKKMIEAKEIDNVILMTDSDPGCSSSLQVPGFAWLLFYDTYNKAYIERLSGKRGTKVVMIQPLDK